MAICKKCGNKYLTKNCNICNQHKNLNNNHKNKTYTLNQNNSFNKNRTKNITLIIIATAVTIIAFVMIFKEYKKYQEEKQIIEMFYGTTDSDEIEKINKKLKIKTEKTMKELRKLYQ